MSSEDNDGTTAPSTFVSDHIDGAVTDAAILATGYGVAKSVDTIASKYVEPKKIPMTKEDLASSGYTTDEDRNGNEITQKDGKFYKGEDLLDKDNPKADRGPIQRAANSATSKIANKFDTLIGGKPSPESTNSAFDDTFNNSESKKNPEVNGETPSEIEDGINHNKLLKSDNSIITKNGERVKKTSTSLSDAIDKQEKSVEDKAMNDKISNGEYAEKIGTLDELKEAVENGYVHKKALENAGIDTKGLKTDSKGFVDMAGTDSKNVRVAEKAHDMNVKKGLFADGENIVKDKESVKSHENGGKPTTPSQEIDQAHKADLRSKETSFTVSEEMELVKFF